MHTETGTCTPRLERWIHGILQLLLLAAFIATLRTAWLLPVVGERLQSALLLQGSGKMVMDVFRTDRDLQRDVAFFPPPASPAELDAWAVQVQEHLDYPAAVLLRERGELRVVRIPEHLRVFLPALPALFDSATRPRDRAKADTVGWLVAWYGDVRVDSARASLRLFQRLGEDRAWGVLRAGEDVGRAFFSDLFAATAQGDYLKAKPWVQEYTLNNGPPVGVRAFIGDSLLGATARLDTANAMWADTLGRLRLEFYLPWYDQLSVHALRKNRTLTALLILEPVLMLVLFRYHRHVRRGAKALNA